MKIFRTGTLVLGLCLLGTMLVPNLKADQWNQRTIVTFSGPVEIPGRVLPAGTYVFRLLDSASDRDIVQIFNKDETKLYATLLAISDYRMQPTGKTVITFEERAKGSPEAVKAWFYPGDNFGQEFVYPKPRAMELAKATKQPVLSMPAETAANITKPAKTASEPHVVAMKKAPVKAITPEGNEVEMANVMPPKPPVPMKQLPTTGSDLPLIALLGVVALALGAGLRLVSKQIA